MKRKRMNLRGARVGRSKSRRRTPYTRFKRGRTKSKKHVKNVVHSMKHSNQLQVCNFNKQSTTAGTAWQPHNLQTEDLTYGIQHESFEKEVDENGVIITEPEDLAKACSRRSGNEIYLTALRLKYRVELNNDAALNQFGDGVKMKWALVIDKYEQGVPIEKDMFAYSSSYQKHRDAFGNDLDHESMFQQGISPQMVYKGRDFGDDNKFFDKFETINAGLNKKRYTLVKAWNFYFKRKYIGDEQIKRGTIMYPFANQKIKYFSEPKQQGDVNTYVTRPSKNYKLIMWYERMGGETTAVTAKAPLKIRVHGNIYWKDAAPFDC